MKAKKLNIGDTIGIVSLSSGMLGEDFSAHELEIAKNRIESYGFKLKFMPNSLKGIDFIKNNPKARAEDLLAAFNDKEVKGIICSIGGDDTYRLAPYLFENDELAIAISNNPKLFLGFSDTTVNHMMLYKCGLNTFYGQALLPDVAELDREMLPYTKEYFEKLFLYGEIEEITPSPTWYEERKSFDALQIGISRFSHKDTRGYEVLQGECSFKGKILGGCLESLFDMLTGDRYSEEKEFVEKYGLFPTLEEWKGKILLLETSESNPDPDFVKKALEKFKQIGIFNVVAGVLVGKPMDEKYYEEYKNILIDTIENPELPILYNLNVGHSTPRCIIPLGIEVEVKDNKIIIKESILE